MPAILWPDVLSDSLIAVSFAVLLVCLVLLARKLPSSRQIPGSRLLSFAFGLVLASFSAVYALQALSVSWPTGTPAIGGKVLCAAASVLAAVLLALHTSTLASQSSGDPNGTTAANEQPGSAVERLSRILDATADRIVAVGWDWTIQYANRQMLNLKPALQIGAGFWEAFQPDLPSHAQLQLRKAMLQRVETSCETYNAPTDEWFMLCAFPTPDGVAVFATSVTVHKRLKEELEAERVRALSQLNAVLDSTSDGVLNVAPDWTVLYGNRKAKQVLPDLVIGRSFWECFPASRRTAAEDHLRRSMKDRVETEYESYYDAYGEWFITHAYPTSDGISIFFRPITERKKLEQQLEGERNLREQRIIAMSNMAGGLAHEISNPLAIIHGTAADLMGLTVDDPEAALVAVQHASKTIVQTSDRAIRILRGLRGFTREAANDPMENASIYEIVDQAMQMQESRLQRHDIEVKALLPPGLPMVVCRETQIGQILTNLLNNAADAILALESEPEALEERWIVVEASTGAGALHIDVIDSGRGINEDTRKRLMEPFFTTKTRGVGLGIGLSLSRAIAIEHGGSLNLIPELGNTCFRLTLPISHVPAAAQADASAQGSL